MSGFLLPCDPPSLAEYSKLAIKRQRMSGHGMNTIQHLPCPFCAADDMIRYRILDVERVLANGATCRVCGRSFKALFNRPSSGQVVMKLVKTGGPKQPYYLNPQMQEI